MVSFKCDNCDKIYAHKRSLVNHIRVVHGGKQSIPQQSSPSFHQSHYMWGHPYTFQHHLFQPHHQFQHQSFNQELHQLQQQIQQQKFHLHSLQRQQEQLLQQNQQQIQQQQLSNQLPYMMGQGNQIEYLQPTIHLQQPLASSSYTEREPEHPSPSTSLAAREREFPIKQIESAFKNCIASYRYDVSCVDINIDGYLQEASKYFRQLIEDAISHHHTIKLQIVLNGEYMKVTDGITLTNLFHKTKVAQLTRASYVDEAIDKYMADLKEKLSMFQTVSSGWTLLKIENIDIHIFKCTLTHGSSYICSPETLKKKRACLNIENSDEFCFKWCIIAALDIQTYAKPQDCTSYDINDIRSEIITLKDGTIINFTSMKFPLDVKEIKIFEMQNNFSINVFGYEEKLVVGPFYITQGEKRVHINLLLLEKCGKFHYILVRNISR